MNRLSLLSILSASVLLAASAAWADTLQVSSMGVDKIEGVTPDKSAGGKALTLGGTAYEHGIGVNGDHKIILYLNGGSDHFSATVGVDDEVKGEDQATVLFTVRADGRQIFQSRTQAPAAGQGAGPGAGRRGRGAPPMNAGDPPQTVDLDVKGVRVLELETSSGAFGGRGPAGANHHGDWADAKIDFSGVKPQIVIPAKEDRYVLTPAAPDTPRINGARIFGVRPNHPFLFTVAATGVRPIQFSAEGLPAGLRLDPNTGFITGKTAAAGPHVVKLTAKNAKGSTDSTLKIVVGNTICLTPQLGWNSWNCFGPAVTGENIKAAADAMVSSGLINHGWNYVNIDDYWEYNQRLANSGDPTMEGVTPRQPDGTISTNKRFPDMKGLVDHIHSIGLKAGIYSGPGPTTCGGCTASWEHEEQDAKTFADWGFDYLKYDWCSYNQTLPNRANPPMSDIATLRKPYDVMRDALLKQDRDIVFSLCQYGWGEVWKWGESAGGNSWRTTGDITDTWQSLTSIWDNQAERNGQPTEMYKYAGPGHWNDADMMIVGMVSVASGRNFHWSNLSPNEQYTHVSAWILMACPMLIGCDMTRFDDFTLNLLSNDEVLAINQDPLGKAAGRILKQGEFEVWAKDMEDGSKAVGIFNRSEVEGPFTLKWSDLGISGKQTVRDAWRQKDVGTMNNEFAPVVPRHGVVLVKITPSK